MARPKKYDVRTVDDLAHQRWCAMHTRVRSQERHKHAVITPEWFCFIKFKQDMGECPEGYSLERINNDLGYNKDNCKWIPIPHQNKNKKNVTIVYGKTFKELCELVGVAYKTVWYRVKRKHMSIDEAILYKADEKQRKKLEEIREGVHI